MTFEHWIVVEPKDIKSIVFECRECGATMGIPTGQDVAHGEKLLTCPSCNKGWLLNPEGAGVYRRFMLMLDDLIKRQEENQPFRMLLMLDDPRP